jgi:hypothetical protein
MDKEFKITDANAPKKFQLLDSKSIQFSYIKRRIAKMQLFEVYLLRYYPQFELMEPYRL